MCHACKSIGINIPQYNSWRLISIPIDCNIITSVTVFEEDAEPDLALADRQRRCHLNALLGRHSGENKIDNYKKEGAS